MARASRAHDDDVDMEVSPKKKTTSSKKKAQEEEEEGEEEEESEEETAEGEYTVEKILQATHHRDGVKGWSYEIKWDGYDEKTWEPEDNVVSEELLDAFWLGREKTRNTKVKGTHVGPQKAIPSPNKKKAPVSSSSSKKEASVPVPSPNKRRSSGRVAIEKEEDDDDDEEEVAPVASSSSKKRKAVEPEPEEEEEPIEEPEVVEDEEEEVVAAPSAKKQKVVAAAAKKKAEKKVEVQVISSDEDDDDEEAAAPTSSKKKPVAVAKKPIAKRVSAAASNKDSSPSPAASAKGLKNGATPPAKRATPATNGKKSRLSEQVNNKPETDEDEEVEQVDNEEDPNAMMKDATYSEMESWEEVVERVETIERAAGLAEGEGEGEPMIVHMKLIGVPTRKTCTHGEARKMIPDKLITFYASHIRFKTKQKGALA